MHYAQQPGKPALVFEMQLGMIDRGAELGWISQYPYEAECLFAPLTGELRLAILFILRLVLAKSLHYAESCRALSQASRCRALASTALCS